jgi:26S proteasome regulatory subunit T5
VDPSELRPGDLIGTNKDSYLILEKLPTEYDPRVKVRGDRLGQTLPS